MQTVVKDDVAGDAASRKMILSVTKLSDFYATGPSAAKGERDSHCALITLAK